MTEWGLYIVTCKHSRFTGPLASRCCNLPAPWCQVRYCRSFRWSSCRASWMEVWMGKRGDLKKSILQIRHTSRKLPLVDGGQQVWTSFHTNTAHAFIPIRIWGPSLAGWSLEKYAMDILQCNVTLCYIVCILVLTASYSSSPQRWMKHVSNHASTSPIIVRKPSLKWSGDSMECKVFCFSYSFHDIDIPSISTSPVPIHNADQKHKVWPHKQNLGS